MADTSAKTTGQTRLSIGDVLVNTDTLELTVLTKHDRKENYMENRDVQATSYIRGEKLLEENPEVMTLERAANEGYPVNLLFFRSLNDWSLRSFDAEGRATWADGGQKTHKVSVDYDGDGWYVSRSGSNSDNRANYYEEIARPDPDIPLDTYYYAVGCALNHIEMYRPKDDGWKDGRHNLCGEEYVTWLRDSFSDVNDRWAEKFTSGTLLSHEVGRPLRVLETIQIGGESPVRVRVMPEHGDGATDAPSTLLQWFAGELAVELVFGDYQVAERE